MSEPALLIVGFGLRGRQWRAVVEGHRGCRVAGVVDPDGRARAAAEAEGLATWATLGDALGASHAGAAIVATPPALHASNALECLAAGVAVLVEKPLAPSLEDAAAVADAADATGLPVVVGHNFRHRPIERALRRALAAGSIGELRVAAIASARPSRTRGHELLEHAPLWDLGVHHLDLLRMRIGAEPDAVMATLVQSPAGVTYTLHLDWDGRAAADYWLHEGASVYHHAEWLEGPLGALRAVDGRGWLVTPDGRPRRLRPPRGAGAEHTLLDALLGSDAGANGARDALGTVATVEAAVRSLTLERPVRLAELAVGARS